MVGPLKRPFKIWSKSAVFNPNLSRFNSALTTLGLPSFQEYFFLYNYVPLRLTRRVVVRSTEYAYISKSTIEAFRKVISPYFRKRKAGVSKFFIRCYPFLPLMKKPAEVRMGGGKGSKLRDFVSPVKPGQILFEISFRPTRNTVRLFSYAARKLNVKVAISYVLYFTCCYG